MNLIPRNRQSDFDYLFNNFFGGFPALSKKPEDQVGYTGMRVDITENENGYDLIADLPGVKKENVSVSLKDDILTISASRSDESERRDEGKVVHRERSFGEYLRSFSVGRNISQNDIKADFSDGVLRVSVPRSGEEVSPQNIKID